MNRNIRASLWLLALSLVLCSIVYPLVLWAFGQTVFPDRADGSLIVDPQTGQPVGSRLIGQPFTRDEYFQPRPSAAGSGNGYNAAASGASNYGASNPLLRARVAQQLGPMVRYQGAARSGNTVQKDIETWFARWPKEHPKVHGGVVARWAKAHPSVAAAWVKTDDAHKDYVKGWMTAHPEAVAIFVQTHPDNRDPQPEDLAVDFFQSYARRHPAAFPSYGAPEGKSDKVWQDVKDGPDIQSFFFDMWLQEHPDAPLEQVPADLVMASGSGLDPDITLKNALYQLDSVAAAWAQKIIGNPDKAAAAARVHDLDRKKAQIRDEIADMLQERASAPLGGLAGGKLVNVLEMNLALRERYGAHP